MRSLKFIVEGQTLKPDPNCDFSGLIPGSEGFLQAEFMFSPEWREYVKVVEFRSIMGKEYTPQLIKNDGTCVIPTEALQKRKFKIRIIARGANETKLITNKITIDQNGGISV